MSPGDSKPQVGKPPTLTHNSAVSLSAIAAFICNHPDRGRIALFESNAGEGGSVEFARHSALESSG